MKKNDQTLVFVHVPKTAGSTIYNILDSQYKRNFTTKGINPQKFVDAFLKYSPEQIEKFDVVKGHFTLQLLHRIQNPVVFTFLRDPVEKFISSYYYIKRAHWNRNHVAVNKLKNIDEFVDFAVRNGIDNAQTRHLSNSIKEHPNSESPKMANEGIDLLKLAKNNLDRMDYVFYTSQFDLAILILAKELQWHKKPFYVTKNRTKNRPSATDISSETIERIREIEKYDIELFDYSKAKNTALISSVDLERELKVFRFQNKMYQKLEKSIPSRIFNKISKKL